LVLAFRFPVYTYIRPVLDSDKKLDGFLPAIERRLGSRGY